MTFCEIPDNASSVERWARARALAHWCLWELFALVTLSIIALLFGCTSAQRSYEPRRLEPALRQLITQYPDSVVGVLLRLTRNVEREDSAALTRSGFAIGSARDRIVTGWARGTTLRLLSAWPQVEWMEMSANVPITPRRTQQLTSAGWREIQR